jgi:hypothetical protein
MGGDIKMGIKHDVRMWTAYIRIRIMTNQWGVLVNRETVGISEVDEHLPASQEDFSFVDLTEPGNVASRQLS